MSTSNFNSIAKSVLLYAKQNRGHSDDIFYVVRNLNHLFEKE